MTTQSNDGFLARWSRLKHEARDGEGVDAVLPEDAAVSGRQHAMLDDGGAVSGPSVAEAERARAPAEDCDDPAPGDGARPPTDFSEFDFDSLDFDADYERFMDRDVPHDVRNKALRKLWLSNPVLANMDGLDDYCEDYTDAAVVPIGGVKTAYRLGRGFLSDEEVAEWEALGRPVVADADGADDTEIASETGGGTSGEPSAADDEGERTAAAGAEETATETDAAAGPAADGVAADGAGGTTVVAAIDNAESSDALTTATPPATALQQAPVTPPVKT